MSLFTSKSRQSSTITTSRGPVPVSEKNFRLLGSAGGHRYLERDGREFAVMSAQPDADYQLKPGEILVSREKQVILSDGARDTDHVINLAVEVEAGSWEKLSKRRQPKERPMRVWSALSDLLQPKREKLPMVLGENRNPDVGALAAASGSGAAVMMHTDEPAITVTPAGILSYLESKGWPIRRAGNSLVIESRTAPAGPDLQLFERMAPLLLAELGGPAISCTTCDKPAVVPLHGYRAFACAEHAGA